MSKADVSPPDDTVNWILCSSGAHPLYLENVLRVLALPAGEHVKFRYESQIVSDKFKELVGNPQAFESVPVDGHFAHMAYLDNRDKLRPPEVYPVREGRIKSVSLLGTTYIIEIELLCFFNWATTKDLSDKLAASAIDLLPRWKKQEHIGADGIDWEGKWVAAAKPLPRPYFSWYSGVERTHLKAFEATANTLVGAADFSDGRWLFLNVTGLFDAKTKALISSSGLRAGRTYEILAYHYHPDNGTHAAQRDFTLSASSDNQDVVVVDPTQHAIAAPYDEHLIRFHVSPDAKDSEVKLGLALKRLDGEGGNDEVILRCSLDRKVQSGKLRKVGFGILIGLGLFGSQSVTLLTNENSTPVAFVAALVFSMLAGIVAAFQLKAKI